MMLAGGAQAAPPVEDLLLDDYPGAVAAYSLRELSSAWTGQDVIRVRESGSNTEQDFTAAEITNGTLATFCGTNDGFVVTWYDQSGQGNDATQSTAASQPKIYDGTTGLITENGKVAIDFDTVDDYLQTSTFSTAYTQPITRILVAKQRVDGYLIDGSSLNRGVVGTEPVRSFRRIFAGTIAFYATSTTNTQELLYAIFDSPNSQLFVDGVGQGLVNVGSGGLDQVTINTIWSTDIAFAGGVIQEIVIYPNDQAANQSGIESDINAYYSIY